MPAPFDQNANAVSIISRFRELALGRDTFGFWGRCLPANPNKPGADRSNSFSALMFCHLSSSCTYLAAANNNPEACGYRNWNLDVTSTIS